MIEDLLIGLPGQRPGGLALSLLFFVAAAISAVAAGLAYATLCVAFPRASLPAQAVTALLRGVPPLLLVFGLGQAGGVPVSVGAFAALALYSFSHVGEILRSFLGSYPAELREQGRVLGLRALAEWRHLRVPWTLRHALDALATHWISLLKDTGALIVLWIGELTTVTRILTDSRPDLDYGATVIAAASAMYLAATLSLIAAVGLARRLPALRQARVEAA